MTKPAKHSMKRTIMKKKSAKSRTVRANTAKLKGKPEDEALAPHSFVVRRGLVTNSLKALMSDYRKVMEPFTASSLKAGPKTHIKGFVSVAGMLHVSHLCAFTGTEKGQYLKLCRFPRGPTLTFRIKDYALSSDIVSLQRKQLVYWKQFKYAPLVVLNGFSGEGEHLKLMSTMFQNLFPTINLTKVNLSSIRRCLLLNYDPETRLIDFRHYAIKVAPTGISKGVKKLLQNKVPDLSKFSDITEFMTKSGLLSDSEAEDDPNSHVTVPQHLAFRGSQVAETSAIRLFELGPRMSLQLLKVQEGLMEGEVLYHDLLKKTDAEKEATRKRREARKRLKEKRKREQELNKRKKEKEKEESKMKSLEGIERKRQQMLEEQKKRRPMAKDKENKLSESDTLMRKAVLESEEAVPVSDDDDADWYRKEVGEEPDNDLFAEKRETKRPAPWSSRAPWKKPKLDKQYSNRFNKSISGHRKGNKNRDDGRNDRPYKSKSGGKRDNSRGNSNKANRGKGPQSKKPNRGRK